MANAPAFPPALLLVFILVAVVIVAGIVLAYQAMKRRRQAFEAEARRLGLQYEPKTTEDLHKVFRDIGPFKEGRGGSPRCLNVVRGRYHGWDVRCVDFEYTVSTGKSSHTVYLRTALAFVPAPWPDLTIVPETLGHKIADAFGADDIDFESEEFSRQFWVKSPDRRFAYDVIHPRTMDYLMVNGGERWHVAEGIVCLWDRKRMKPHDVAPLLDRLVGFVQLIPVHVQNQYGGVAAPRRAAA